MASGGAMRWKTIHRKNRRLEEAYRDRDATFGNVRYVKGIVNDVKAALAQRLRGSAANASYTELTNITLADVESVFHSATARGLTFSVVFDGKNIESRFPIREAGNNKIVAPVPAANLAEVSAMFAKLAANIAARMADDAEYDAHVAGVKKMMNA